MIIKFFRCILVEYINRLNSNISSYFFFIKKEATLYMIKMNLLFILKLFEQLVINSYFFILLFFKFNVIILMFFIYSSIEIFIIVCKFFLFIFFHPQHYFILNLFLLLIRCVYLLFGFSRF
jgi:hypothetical protein